MTVALQSGEDFVLRRFCDGMGRIARKFRSDHPRQLPASPCAPTALLAAGLIHPIGQMLEMDSGVSDENIVGSVA